jgi:GntR family transcriptional regulator
MSFPNPTKAGTPLYRQAELTLLKNIKAGRYKAGQPIPTEKELAKDHGVSQGTMRLAILELVNAGVLYRKQGVGTFIAGLRLDQSADRFFRYGLHNEAKLLAPETRLLEKGTVEADSRIAEALNIKPKTKAGWLRRLRLYSGEPFLYYDSFFPLQIWTRMHNCDFAASNLYEHMQQQCDISIVRADEYLSPALATKEDHRILGSKVGSPVVRLERHSFGFQSKKIEFRISVGRGDNFSYHVRL